MSLPATARTLVVLATSLAFAGLGGPARATDAGAPGELTLERALVIAETANSDLEAARHAARRAAAARDEAGAGWFPTVGLDAGVVRSDNPTLVFSNKLAQERFAAGDFDLGALNRPDPLTNWQTRVTVEQPLWTGGRLAAAERLASARHDAALAGVDAGRDAVRAAVVDAWSGAILARRQVEVTLEALATAEAHARVTRDLFDAGLVVESDVLRTEVRLREVREMTTRAETAVATSNAGLAAVLGRSPDLAIPDALPDPPEAPEDPDSLVERARTAHSEVRAAALEAEAAARAVDLVRAGNRPTVGLQGAVEANDRDPLGTEGTNWTAGVGLRWTLFEGPRRRARKEAAEADLAAARARLRSLEARSAVDVLRAWADLRSARSLLEETDASIGLAERGLRIVEDRYREGLTTLPELLDAETTLTRARLRHARARREGWVAAGALDRALGGPLLLPAPTPDTKDADATVPASPTPSPALDSETDR